MLVKTTSKHAMMLELCPVGRYRAKQIRVYEKQNNAGTGTNAVYEFEISEGPYEGKVLEQYCSIGNDFGIANMRAIHVAITEEEGDELTFDPEKDNGGLLTIDVGHELYNGKQTARITGFMPATVSLENPF